MGIKTITLSVRLATDRVDAIQREMPEWAAIIREVLAANPDPVADFRTGRGKASTHFSA